MHLLHHPGLLRARHQECIHYADDIALLLLEAGECGKELITPAEIRELAGIAADAGVTWNVHLPTDGGFATEESSRRYTENIIRAIDLTRELEPHTWVMHVVTDHIPGPDMRPHLTERETERILRSLEQITPTSRTGMPGPGKFGTPSDRLFGQTGSRYTPFTLL